MARRVETGNHRTTRFAPARPDKVRTLFVGAPERKAFIANFDGTCARCHNPIVAGKHWICGPRRGPYTHDALTPGCHP